MELLIRKVRLAPVGSSATEGPVDLRVRGGAVVEVGAGLRPYGDVLDADGRWALPGLWDAHVHLALWARTRGRLDVSAAHGPEEVTRLVREHLAQRGDPGRLLVGQGHRSATWRRRATVAELDAAAPDTPVVLVSGDAHNGWLNARALALLGLPPREGPLEEDEWFEVFARLPEDDDVEALCRAAAADALSRGVVGLVDMEFGTCPLDQPWRGDLGLHVRAATYPEVLDRTVSAGLRTGDPVTGLLTTGPLKVISDGSLNTRTAHCCQPYDGGTGVQNVPAEALTSLLHRARQAGLRAAVHAIGDAAVRIALDAYEATGASGTVEHAQLVADADLPRFARLGVAASVQPAHLLDDRAVSEHVWPDRTARCFPLGALRDAGATLALGSDAPVARLDPWLAMAAAVHRSRDGRDPWHPEQSLTPAQALAASTDVRTTVAVGSPADLVLLDDDPLAVAALAPDQACAVRAAATLVAGEPRHLAF